MSADRVEGGTNAGWKNPFHGRAAPWQCECSVSVEEGEQGLRKTNLGALRRCPDCGAERPVA